MKFPGCFLLAAIGAAACGGYSAPDEVVFGTGVYTQPAPTSPPGQDPSTIFKPLSSYYLDPTVEVWHDGEQQAPAAFPSGAAQIINTRMTAYGYTAGTPPPIGGVPGASVGLRASYFQNTFSYYYSGGWCTIYWGWYGCYPTWGYAGSYSTGTVVLVMTDLRTNPPGPNDQRPILWVSGLYSVLQGQVTDTANFSSALTKAFDQSPYLDTH